jgi:co-chaperonin GroES (HSP10)
MVNAALARKTALLSQAADPKKAIFEAIGDTSGDEVMHNQILVVTYVRPEKTSGGIIRPDQNIAEDEYQGKVGLVVKKGKTAFLSDDQNDFMGQDVHAGDWVVYRIGDGWPVTIRGVACRMLTDRSIRMKVRNPEDYF